jgi:hypothetical protein
MNLHVAQPFFRFWPFSANPSLCSKSEPGLASVHNETPASDGEQGKQED